MKLRLPDYMKVRRWAADTGGFRGALFFLECTANGNFRLIPGQSQRKSINNAFQRRGRLAFRGAVFGSELEQVEIS